MKRIQFGSKGGISTALTLLACVVIIARGDFGEFGLSALRK